MKVNALQLRQSLGSILLALGKKDDPIIVEKNREPVAVLISIKVFKERFVDFLDKEKQEELILLAKQSAKKSSQNSLSILRELRYGLNDT
jgi:PHD/YefM family antitoxin component YafN of YafNO toxin-antitoxin module